MISILIVEDDQLNREMLRIYFGSEGYAVMTARSGEEALELARSQPPDAVVLDMGLPGLDGWEVVSRMRADPLLAPVPVIALTAYAMWGDRERCLAAGCDDYCSKPVDLGLLNTRILALVEGSGGRAIELP